MGVTCPACGGQSQDPEFCDHCNADLIRSPGLLPPEQCRLSGHQVVTLTPAQVSTLSRPGTSVIVRDGQRSWRLHWFSKNAWEHRRKALEERLALDLPCLPSCRCVEEASGVWLLAECSGCPAVPWRRRDTANPLKDLRSLCRALDKLAAALEYLHSRALVWLTFDPAEIEEVGGGASAEAVETHWRFTNLDTGVFHSGSCPEQLQANPAFTAPEVARFQAADLGPATNVYHLALFAYYWLAGVLPRGFGGSGLEAFGHRLPPLRIYAPDLPPGIVGVLTRGLAVEPRQRWASPSAFCAALDKARRRAEQRATAGDPVSWEIGFHSRTGRAKAARGYDNEDFALARTYRNPDRALVAVADGITTCDIGSGALASFITCDLLENALDERTNQQTFPGTVTGVCRHGSAKLLDWAVTKGYANQLVSGRDLMGSTLLAGWLEGNTLTLANVGDSRAYLIDGPTVEQLTVDGDLGSELLASGAPPEEIKGLGIMARGLRDCIGGCSVQPDGGLTTLDDYCQPKLSRWRLVPGDIVILCSDGLVEEETFLEPETMGEIVRSHAHLPAAALAEQLAQTADAMQRPPSALEPEGFGDNITCIVIKIASSH